MRCCTYLLGVNTVLPIIFIVVILLLLLYNGIRLALTHEDGIRRNERFLTDLPIRIRYTGNEFIGRVKNISEGGLAFRIRTPIYIPKEEEQVTYYITVDEDKIHFRGEVVHVDEQDGEWSYSIKVLFEEDQERLKYVNLLKEVREEERKIWGKSFGVKVIKNLVSVSKRKVSSKRKTARIQVNELCDLSDGTVLVLDNYNYEYVRVSLVKGVLMDKIVLFPTKSYAMHCTQSPWNPYLFSIDNQKELNSNVEFQELIEEWCKKGTSIH